MNKNIKLLIIMLVFVFLVVGCTDNNNGKDVTGTDNQSTEESNGNYEGFAKGPNGEEGVAAEDIELTDDEYNEIKKGNYKAAMLWAGAGEWYNAMTDGAKAEFEKMGIEVVAVSDAQFDPAKQSTDIETSLALQPDIILSLPVDPVSGTQAFKPVVEKDIALIFADNGVDNYKPGEDYVAIVTGDHYGMGRAAADLIAESIDNKGKIGFIFHDADFFVTNNRDNAFKNRIETEYPEIEIIASGGFSEENATGDVAAAMLTKNPDIDGIYVAWDVAAEPVIAELRALGMKDVKVVTHDLGGNNDLDMAQGGNVYGKVADRPYQIGETMAKLAGYKILEKEAPSFVLGNMITMTKENMIEAWEKSLNKKPAKDVIDILEKK